MTLLQLLCRACNSKSNIFLFSRSRMKRAFLLLRACVSILNSYVCRNVFLADPPTRVSRTIKSSWHHPSQSPLVRSAFQGLADHPIGLSTAPAPAQSVHCASTRHAYIYIYVYIYLRPCTHARTECAGGFTDTRRYTHTSMNIVHTHIHARVNPHALACDAETHSRAIAEHHVPSMHPRAFFFKTDHVAFRVRHTLIAREHIRKEMIVRLRADRCT